MSSLLSSPRKQTIASIVSLLVAFLLGLTIGLSIGKKGSKSDISLNSDIIVPMDPFPEPAWRPQSLLGYKTVASTPFARFEIHKVKTETGEIINDWLWTDERSHVNILVHLKESDKYLLFHQKKYGLDQAKYAVVGGLFNVGESDPSLVAHRELLEEAGLVTDQMYSTGSYRVQVNRGGGILHTFLAKNCVPAKLGGKTPQFEKDYEKQEVKLLTTNQLIDITLRGDVGEAQWVAAVALGLLFEEHSHHHMV
jgi:8-oxo-dGTP pyrophosphatase MutT (NUDIX family)